MNSNDPFLFLGLERKTATDGQVRKAYAAKLKVARPDDDPEGFMALRNAYTSARNILKWQESTTEQLPIWEALEGDEDAPDTDAQQLRDDDNLNDLPEQSILDLIFGHCERWIDQKGAEDPEAFFKDLSSWKSYGLPNVKNSVSHWFMSKLLPDDDDALENPYKDTLKEPVKPAWLHDETILVLFRQFRWWDQEVSDSWLASRLNFLRTLMEPALLAHGAINASLPEYDVEEFYIREITGYNEDQYGSYYDRPSKSWVDMSPVGRALQSLDELADEDNVDDYLARWKSILESEELDGIEEFQELDRRLLSYICGRPEFEGLRVAPVHLPDFLTGDVLRYLESQFGWAGHAPRRRWQYDEYEWFRLLAAPYLNSIKPKQNAFSQKVVDRLSFDFLGYQTMPWLLRPTILIVIYIIVSLAGKMAPHS